MAIFDESTADPAALPGVAARYRALLDAAPDLIFIVRGGRVRYLNAISARLLNKPAGDDIDEPLESLFPLEAAEEQRSQIARVFATGQSVNHTLRMPLPHGVLWLDVTLAPLRGPGTFPEDVMGIARDVTATHDADELYQTIIRSALDGFRLTDIEGRLLDVNDAYVEMSGYSRSELLTMRVSELEVGESGERIPLRSPDIVESGRNRHESKLRRKDGSFLSVDVAAHALPTRGGKVVAFLRGISASKEADTALRASETRYRRLFESAKDGILIVDVEDGRVVDVNPFLTDLLGYSYADVLGKTLWDLGPFQNIIASQEAFSQLLERKYIRFDNMPLETCDGRRLAVEFVSNVYEVEGTSVVQCNIRDITERNRAATEHARLVLAIEQTSDMIVVTDAQARIQYVNPAFEAITGYQRADIIGVNPRILNNGVLEERFYEDLWGTISSGKTWSGRFVNKKRDGTLFTSDATVSPVRDKSGVIQSYVSVARDTTQELSLEQQLFGAQKMESIGRLAGGVAHDFNNLLCVILSYARFAMEAAGDNTPLMEDLEEIMKASERAAALTRQLLAFSRKQLLQPLVLDLNEIALGVEKMLRRIVGEDVDLVIALAPKLGMVMADPNQIEQVLMNLAVNARDAMPEGGKLTIGTANVELDAEYCAQHPEVAPGSYVAVSVSDSGVGMNQHTAAQIFDPFFTTKTRDKGTGLGLSTAYGIIKQSGGSISVYSEPGHGTTFKVYLPRERSATEAASTPPQPLRPVYGAEVILVVEDEQAIRKVITRFLVASGYKVLTAASGSLALEIAAQHRVDLVLTDVIMPGMNGRMLARALSRAQPAVKVLYMSGYTDDAIAHHGVLDAGTHFIGKPFTPGDLTRKVRDLLDERSSDA